MAKIKTFFKIYSFLFAFETKLHIRQQKLTQMKFNQKMIWKSRINICDGLMC